MLFLFSVVVFAAGLGFDLMRRDVSAFWIGAEPGARAVLGALAGIIVLAAAHVLRLVLGRPIADAPNKGARRAGDHP